MSHLSSPQCGFGAPYFCKDIKEWRFCMSYSIHNMIVCCEDLRSQKKFELCMLVTVGLMCSSQWSSVSRVDNAGALSLLMQSMRGMGKVVKGFYLEGSRNCSSPLSVFAGCGTSCTFCSGSGRSGKNLLRAIIISVDSHNYTQLRISFSHDEGDEGPMRLSGMSQLVWRAPAGVNYSIKVLYCLYIYVLPNIQ